MTETLPPGFKAGFIAVEAAGCGDDITYYVLNQQQMDEVDNAAKTNSDYCEIMNDVIDRHNLGDNGERCSSIKEALEYMLGQKMILVEDFSYIAY